MKNKIYFDKYSYVDYIYPNKKNYLMNNINKYISYHFPDPNVFIKQKYYAN